MDTGNEYWFHEKQASNKYNPVGVASMILTALCGLSISSSNYLTKGDVFFWILGLSSFSMFVLSMISTRTQVHVEAKMNSDRIFFLVYIGKLKVWITEISIMDIASISKTTFIEVNRRISLIGRKKSFITSSNSSGVEIVLQDGRIYRYGTAEPFSELGICKKIQEIIFQKSQEE